MTTKESASSATLSDSPSSTCPIPADRFSVCATSMRWSVRKRRPCAALCDARETSAAEMMRATFGEVGVVRC